MDGGRLAGAAAAARAARTAGERARYRRDGPTAPVPAWLELELADLPAQHPRVHAYAPVPRARPTRLRGLGHAFRADLDPGLREDRRRDVRRARRGDRVGGRELDGRLHRR